MKVLFATFAVILISFSAAAEEVWKNYSKKDEMSGEQSFYTYTNKIKPTRTMSFPYQNTTSFIALMCSKKRVTFSFLFNIAPNLNNKETVVKNYDSIKTRIKFGEKINNVDLLQRWGGKQITLRNNEQYLADLNISDELLLELDWHGDGKVYFKYTITGFSKAYEDLKTRCGA